MRARPGFEQAFPARLFEQIGAFHEQPIKGDAGRTRAQVDNAVHRQRGVRWRPSILLEISQDLARERGLADACPTDHAHESGRRVAQEVSEIALFIENERARRAYIKAGFEPLTEQRSDDWQREIGCPGTEMLLQPL